MRGKKCSAKEENIVAKVKRLHCISSGELSNWGRENFGWEWSAYH
jgi:hypothetical protein